MISCCCSLDVCCFTILEAAIRPISAPTISGLVGVPVVVLRLVFALTIRSLVDVPVVVWWSNLFVESRR